jgi:hypothetical protein
MPMKWICVLLLLANIGYYGWTFNQDLTQPARRAKQAVPSAPGVASLTLLRELGASPRLRNDAPDRAQNSGQSLTAQEPDIEDNGADESISISNPNPMLPSAKVCVTAGPLAEATQSERLRDWLATRSVRVVHEARAIRTRQLYWVFLEPADEAQAQQRLLDLQGKGVSGVELIRRGGLMNAISLGLFSSQEAVNARLDEMQRQGYHPVVVPRYETRREYWLRAELGVGYEELAAIPPELGIEVALARSHCAAFR